MKKTSTIKRRSKTVKERIGVHIDQKTKDRFRIPLSLSNLFVGITYRQNNGVRMFESTEVFQPDLYHLNKLFKAGLIHSDLSGDNKRLYRFDDDLFDFTDLPYYDLSLARRKKLYDGEAMDVSGFARGFYSTEKKRLLSPSEVEIGSNLIDCVPVYDFPSNWRQRWIEEDTLDYIDAAKNEFIWSIAYEYRSGRIVAATTGIFYETNDDFRLLWLR